MAGSEKTRERDGETRAAAGENQRGRGKETPEEPRYDDGKTDVQGQLHTIDFP